jgi:galactitol-specific phosphotransferase system IIB component
MQSFKSVVASVSPHWALIAMASVIGIAAASVRVFEPEEAKARRNELKKQKELRLLAQRISTYAHSVRQQFPTGDVVVSERDLAEQLRKRPEKVVIALNLLLNQQKVQRAPLNGYWKLNA